MELQLHTIMTIITLLFLAAYFIGGFILDILDRIEYERQKKECEEAIRKAMEADEDV